MSVPQGKCDSEVLLRAMSMPGADIVQVLSKVEGPWAAVYWQDSSQTLWIGRDPLGKPQISINPCLTSKALLLAPIHTAPC